MAKKAATRGGEAKTHEGGAGGAKAAKRTRSAKAAAGGGGVKTRGAAEAPRKAASVPVANGASRKAAEPGPFTGFPKDFFAFFRELARNNEREWFKANEQRFRESVEAPLLSFIAAMDLPLGRFANCFEAIPKRSGGSMFRIYRDTRFSRDKSPYKENAACQFRHEAGKDAHAPGFYVHLEPKEVFFGGGLWLPPGPELRMTREAIAADPDRWMAITRAPAFRRRFGGVEGDSLKRPPAGFDADHPCIEDLKRTSFFALQEVKPSAIHSKDFVKEVARSFEALSPFMEFLTEAVGLRFHRED